MPYSTGSVSSFAGGSGLLQTLLSFLKGTEVTGETLSGSGTSWSGTLASSPVGLGRLLVDYAFSSTNYQATDDGSGNITGTNISSGTITYSTGAYSITFTGTPDAAPTADYIYGNPGQDWREELNRTTRDNGGGGYTEPCTGCIEVVLSNTGLSGQEDVIIGIRECFYAAGNFYHWDLNGYTTFLDTGEWDQNAALHGMGIYGSTYNSFYRHPGLSLHDDTMSYWFYSNQQRFVVVAKVASNYEMCYLGFGRRFGNPGDYPYPLLVGGSNSGNRIAADASAYHTWFLANPRLDNNFNIWLLDTGSAYRAWFGAVTNNLGLQVLPYDTWYNAGVLAPTLHGERIMTPVYYTPYISTENSVYFDLDEVYHIAGTGIQSEDLINYSGDRYRVFQNGYRTEYYDYMCVKEGAAVSTTTTTTTTTTSTTTTT
jgi:hypothetical protein